jgi:hypothetical protein
VQHPYNLVSFDQGDHGLEGLALSPLCQFLF